VRRTTEMHEVLWWNGSSLLEPFPEGHTLCAHHSADRQAPPRRAGNAATDTRRRGFTNLIVGGGRVSGRLIRTAPTRENQIARRGRWQGGLGRRSGVGPVLLVGHHSLGLNAPSGASRMAATNSQTPPHVRLCALRSERGGTSRRAPAMPNGRCRMDPGPDVRR
jgi:hypothetical protein